MVYLPRNGLAVSVRLPTEAEWEYACRAGGAETQLDPRALDRVAWHRGNSVPEGQEKPKNQRVGRKKPNAWGLHDMLGGVWEYVAGSWEERGDLAPLVCGGSWNDPPERIRPGARLKGERREWSKTDPNRPYSICWYTNAPFVGFRLAADGPPPGK